MTKWTGNFIYDPEFIVQEFLLHLKKSFLFLIVFVVWTSVHVAFKQAIKH